MAQDADKGRDRAEAATRRPRGGHDWPALRAEWAAGSESLRAFAARKGISRQVVLKRAQADGWQADRDKASAKVSAGVERRAIAHRIRTEAEIDGQAHRAASRFARHVGRMLTGVERLTLDDAPKVKAAAEALEKLHRLARVTAHLPAEPAASVAEHGHIEVIVRGLDDEGREWVEKTDEAHAVGAAAPQAETP